MGCALSSARADILVCLCFSPEAVCTEVTLESQHPADYTTHEMPGDVINMTLVTSLPQSAGCGHGEFGFFGWIRHIVHVGSGCRGVFQVCYMRKGEVRGYLNG